MDWNSVYDFAPNPKIEDFANYSDASELLTEFASNYTSLLVQLHNVFNGHPETYYDTLAGMHQLSSMVAQLFQTQDPRNASRVLGPTWEYVAQASQYAAREGQARPTVEAGEPI